MKTLLLNTRFIRCVILLLFYLTFFKEVQSQSATKTIIYDWRTGFTSPLPFDERFIIQVNNLPADLKYLDLEIKKADDSYKKKNRLGTQEYFDGLGLGQILSFEIIKDRPVISVEFAKLEPNEDYLMAFHLKAKEELSTAEKANLESSLKGKAELKQEIQQELFKQDYFNLSPITLQSIFQKHIELVNSQYQIGNDAGDKSKKEILLKIATTDAKIKNIEAKTATLIRNLSGYLDKKSIKSYDKFLKEGKLRIDYFSKNTLDIFKADLYATNQEILPKVNNDNKSAAQTEISSRESDIGTEIDNYKTEVNKIIDETLINIVVEKSYKLITLNSTSPNELSSKASIYISQSTGAAYSTRTGNIPSYLTYSFFFRPVNQDIALSTYSGNDWWKVRLCMNIGMTFNSVATNKNGVISGVIGDKGLVMGLGFRILPFLKFDANGLVYYLNPPNPLDTHKKINVSPMLGLSLNVNIAKLLAGQSNPLSDLQNYFR